MKSAPPKEPFCDCCAHTRLVEEGSLTWGRKAKEVLPFMVIGGLFIGLLAPALLLLRLGITGQFNLVDGLFMALLGKIGLGFFVGALVGLFSGLFGPEGGLLGGVIVGVLAALAFGATWQAPFDPHQRIDLVLTSVLGGAAIGFLGYLTFKVADKRVVPKT